MKPSLASETTVGINSGYSEAQRSSTKDINSHTYFTHMASIQNGFPQQTASASLSPAPPGTSAQSLRISPSLKAAKSEARLDQKRVTPSSKHSGPHPYVVIYRPWMSSAMRAPKPISSFISQIPFSILPIPRSTKKSFALMVLQSMHLQKV